MPHSMKWEERGVYWKYFGDVSGQEIIDASAVIYGDPRFDNLEYKLVDFLDATTVNMSDDEVARVAYQHKAAEVSNPRIKNAIVTTVALDLADKFANFFTESRWEVQVFQDMESANKWLNREVS